MKRSRLFPVLMMALLAMELPCGSAFASGVDNALESFKVADLVVPGIILMVVLAIMIAIGLFLRNYIKVPTNKVAVVTGRKRKLATGEVVGFRIVKGGAAFRWPVLETVSYLDLNVITLSVATNGAVTKEGVPVDVEAVANVKIGGNDTCIANAAENLLGKSDEEIRDTVKKTLEAHLRTICGTLTIEAINAERQQFSQKISTESEAELNRLGITVIGITVQHIADTQGYIQALGVKRTAEVKRDAAVGQAEATRDSDIKTAQAKSEAQKKSTDAQREGSVAEFKNKEAVSQADRDLKVKQAEMAAQVAAKEAERDQAGPRAKAEAEKSVLVAQVEAQKAKAAAECELQETLAARKAKELAVTVIKPAEADQQKLIIEAEASQKKATIDAEAAKQKKVIDAEAQQKAAVVEAEGYQKAQVMKAQADRDAQIAMAEGAKAKVTQEGEGEAAKIKAIGEAEGAKIRATLIAQAEGEAAQILKKGKAEGEAIRVKLLAEAEGTKKKAEALKQLEDAAKLMFILDRAPEVIEAIGEAAAKALTPAFQAVGQGLGNIDKLTIVESGGNGGQTGLARFAGTAPTMMFDLLQKAKALGLDVSVLMGKLGVAVVESVGVEAGSPAGTGKPELPAAPRS